MPRKTKHFFEQTQELLDKLERELSLFKEKNAPTIAPEPPEETLENDTPHRPLMASLSVLIPGHGAQTQARKIEKASLATPTCRKCESHAFERGLITPLGEQRAVPVLQCASCGAVVGTLNSEQAIDDLQKQIAAIDAGLVRIVKAIQER